jgi:hypothetical protein
MLKRIKKPVGKSECHFEIETEEYKAAYVLAIKNKGTGKIKTVNGSWWNSRPTGQYKLVWD